MASVMSVSTSQCHKPIDRPELWFLAVVQQEPFPPDMSPTSPLLSPQSSTSQTPLLQQAPPPGYQSPDMKSWQQTGISSNRLGDDDGGEKKKREVISFSNVDLFSLSQLVQSVGTGCRADLRPAGGLQQHEHHRVHGRGLRCCRFITSHRTGGRQQ